MKRKKALVIDNPDLEKDLETGVIINNNRTNLLNRKMVKKNIEEKDKETQMYKDLCNTLLERLTVIEAKINQT
jgi:uncharacterized protein YjaG (DUF416 family)